MNPKKKKTKISKKVVIRCPDCNSTDVGRLYSGTETVVTCRNTQHDGFDNVYVTASVDSKEYGKKFRKVDRNYKTPEGVKELEEKRASGVLREPEEGKDFMLVKKFKCFHCGDYHRDTQGQLIAHIKEKHPDQLKWF